MSTTQETVMLVIFGLVFGFIFLCVLAGVLGALDEARRNHPLNPFIEDANSAWRTQRNIDALVELGREQMIRRAMEADPRR